VRELRGLRIRILRERGVPMTRRDSMLLKLAGVGVAGIAAVAAYAYYKSANAAANPPQTNPNPSGSSTAALNDVNSSA
jgi:hypothetical protein